jgi:hypothetical protein
MGSQFSELSIRTFARTAIAYLAGWGVSRHVPGPGNADEDIMELLLRAFLHKFFIGERKFMGRGPKPMKKGDLVCIFYGGKVPFILRPWGDQYYLMGECCKFSC